MPLPHLIVGVVDGKGRQEDAWLDFGGGAVGAPFTRELADEVICRRHVACTANSFTMYETSATLPRFDVGHTNFAALHVIPDLKSV